MMKKFAIAFVVLSMMLVSTAFAEINWGIHGGLDFARYTGTNDSFEDEDSFAPGINIGAVVTMDITDFVSEYVTVEKVVARANVGFAYFKPSSDEFELGDGTPLEIDYSMSAIYIEASAMYYLNDKTYAMLGLGIAPYGLSAEATSNNPFINALITGAVEGETKVGPIIGAGYHFNEKLAAEVSAGTAQIRINTIYFF